jgi:secretion/DNA translocation related TadE-like protein
MTTPAARDHRAVVVGRAVVAGRAVVVGRAVAAGRSLVAGRASVAGRDRGAASILVLAMGLVLLTAGLAAAAVGSAQVARREARNAADLGALAGARDAVFGAGPACDAAARIVTRNHARMTACTVSGLEIVIRTEVRTRLGTAESAARAGPVYAPP